MPNDTVPAAATGLPSSRRGFLRSLTALPLIGGSVAMGAKPSAGFAEAAPPPTIAVEHPDAALIALGSQFAMAMKLRRVLHDRLCEAEGRVYDRLEHVLDPEVLIALNIDLLYGFPLPGGDHGVRGRTWTASQIEEIRSLPPRMKTTGTKGRHVCERTAARKAEILAAHDARAATIREVEDAEGLGQADADWSAAAAAVDEIANQILAARATTFEGLAVKAKLCTERLDGVTAFQPGVLCFENAACSMIADMMAIGGQA